MLLAVTSAQLARTRDVARRAAGRVKRKAIRVRNARLLSRTQPQRYVFIVSGGRSGSTLLQGILNAMPGTLVRGENNFFILPLFRAQRRLQVFQNRFGDKSIPVTSAFYGLSEMDVDDVVRTTRQLMLRQLLGNTDPRGVDVLGFKEVRWENIRPDETEAFFAFFDRVFPGALFVLNERNPEVVIGSGHWQQKDSDEALAALERVGEVQDFLRRTRPGRTYDTTFEVITGDDRAASDAQLKGLAEFVVGACDESLLDDLRAVLKVGHGPYPFGKARKDRKKSASAQADAGPRPSSS
jgi:hypothetical protein